MEKKSCNVNFISSQFEKKKKSNFNYFRVQEKEEDLIFTPFEKNIEVWRQLWRVIEKRYFIKKKLKYLIFFLISKN